MFERTVRYAQNRTGCERRRSGCRAINVFMEAPIMASPTTGPYAGVFPIAPTPFLENGDLDLEGQRRVVDCMIDQGVDGLCILANYSEQFLLSDTERDDLTDLCISHVAGRVPVIVTTSHFSTRIACERAAKAARAGASLLMPSRRSPSEGQSPPLGPTDWERWRTVLEHRSRRNLDRRRSAVAHRVIQAAGPDPDVLKRPIIKRLQNSQVAMYAPLPGKGRDQPSQ
jgi:Dihydrodipicolinate synthetase family